MTFTEPSFVAHHLRNPHGSLTNTDDGVALNVAGRGFWGGYSM